MIPTQSPIAAGRSDAAPYGVPRSGYYWFPWICFGLLLAVFVGWLALIALRAVGIGGGFPYAVWQFFPFGFFFLFFVFFVVFRFGWGGYRRSWGYGGYGRHWGYYPGGAHDILRERYARGEITAEQLRQMTRELDESGRR